MRQLQPGEPGQIGNYRVVGVLGAGGMGQVFLGVGPDGRLAAIKQVLASFADDPGFRARFAGEVEASRKVSGAYTAAVLDADPSAATPWLASVFVAGPPLDDALEAHGPLPGYSMRLLTVGLVIALREIHRVGLVHRDLKPSNVLLTEDGPRVIDFGIATALEGASRLTQTGAVIGSPGFMSPEQVGGHPMTPASDVFSLGAVLTYAMTGVGPFGDAPTPTLMYRIAYTEPDVSRVPPPLHDLVRACLAKDPRRRPTLDQILRATGPVPPGEAWLPPPVQQMIHNQQHAANQLAGARPRPAASPARAPYPSPQRQPTHPAQHGAPGQPLPAPRRSRRWLAALLGVGAFVIALAVAATLVVVLPSDDLSPEEAAALVTAIAPAADEVPDGFRVAEDGAPNEDPLEFDRSQTAFACVVQSDPPTPAEAGIVALIGGSYTEDISTEAGLAQRRFRHARFYTVAYVDAERRTTIMGEIRSRIRECIDGAPRQGVQDFRFSLTDLPNVAEDVGFLANVPEDESDDLDVAPQVINCEFARVEAIVLRSCNLISNDTGRTTARDDELTSMTERSIAPLVERARQEQGVT